MVSVDVDALRPPAAEVALVAGLLAEVGPATAADLAADLDLPLATVGGALRMLERAQSLSSSATASRPFEWPT